MEMGNDYIMFLHKKLYLIEMIARKGLLQGDEILTKIHKICLATPSDIEKRFSELGGSHETT